MYVNKTNMIVSILQMKSRLVELKYFGKSVQSGSNVTSKFTDKQPFQCPRRMIKSHDSDV